MSKGLEALEKVEDFEIQFGGYDEANEYKNYISLYQTPEYQVIREELKALEIIKNNQVDVALFVKSKSAVDYNGLRMIMFRKQAERDYSGVLLKYGLNQEEYDLLRGVLQCQDKD